MSQTIRAQLKSLGVQGSKKRRKSEPEKSSSGDIALGKTPRKATHTKHKKANRKIPPPPKLKKAASYRKNTLDTSASSISSQALRDAYGGGQSMKLNSVPSPQIESPLIEYKLPIQDYWQNQYADSDILLNGHDGIAQDLDWDGGEAVDQIQVGFDFGTSAVKVMLQTSDGNFIPIKFTSSVEAPFVLPSCLYVERGIAKLKGSDKCKVYRDLKLPLLEHNRSVDDIVRAAAFIALALRMVRGWLFEAYKSIYTGKLLIWELNFGVPASLHNNTTSLSFFEDLFQLSYFASIQSGTEIHLAKVEEYWNLRAWDSPESQEQRVHQLHVVPEIAAQIFGVIRSDSWDRRNRLMSVVDIGAGTVDHGVFSITGKDVKQGLHFLRTCVEQNGVVNLHRHRLNQMEATDSNADDSVRAYLSELKSFSDINSPIPDTWQDYIPGTQLIQGSLTPDQTFSKERYSPQVMSLLHDVKKNRYPNPDEWKALPVLICGGGSTTPIYQNLYQKVGVPRSTNGIGFKVIPLITPIELKNSGLTDITYKRMSLAYGLSFSRDLYPKLIRESDIPDFKPQVRVRSVQMVRKDDV